MHVSLTLTEDQHIALSNHLFPGDGLEAVAFLVCGRAAGNDRHRLVVRKVVPIAHARCRRTQVSVSWNAEDIEELLIIAEHEGLSLVKVHGHPGGYNRFSSIDDESDAELLPTIRSWVEHDVPHGSAVMLPCGRLFGRYHWRDNVLTPFTLINIVGPDLKFWWADDGMVADPAFAASQDQAFGEGTTRQLGRLRIGVVGASGTGSPVIEQLVRLGVGHVVPVDPDVVEDRNLNRITFANREHAEQRAKKVAALMEDIERKGLGTKITPIDEPVETPRAIRALSLCDLVIGCVDTVGARFTLSLIAAHYIQGYFDIGVLLDAEIEGEAKGRIKDILGTVHYLVPGRSSLLTRDLFTLEDVAAEGLHKLDPQAAKQLVEDKYIKGLRVRRPAVISVNMFAASLAMNDLLARVHPYRKRPNRDVASIEFSLGEFRITADEELERCPVMSRFVGYGDRDPLLGLPEYGS